MTGDTHQRLAEVLDELEKLGARTPSFRIAALSQHEAETWLRSEQRRLEQLAKSTGELHLP
jgi:hypothetical protein